MGEKEINTDMTDETLSGGKWGGGIGFVKYQIILLDFFVIMEKPDYIQNRNVK